MLKIKHHVCIISDTNFTVYSIRVWITHSTNKHVDVKIIILKQIETQSTFHLHSMTEWEGGEPQTTCLWLAGRAICLMQSPYLFFLFKFFLLQCQFRANSFFLIPYIHVYSSAVLQFTAMLTVVWGCCFELNANISMLIYVHIRPWLSLPCWLIHYLDINLNLNRHV